MSMTALGVFGLMVPRRMPSLMSSALMILSFGIPYFVTWEHWLLSCAIMHLTRHGKSLSSAAAFCWSPSMLFSIHFLQRSVSVTSAESSVKQLDTITVQALDLL